MEKKDVWGRQVWIDRIAFVMIIAGLGGGLIHHVFFKEQPDRAEMAEMEFGPPVLEAPVRPAFTKLDAMALCRAAIRNVSLDPGRADIPYGREAHNAHVFHFYWTHTDGLRLRNGFGADLPVGAACQVDRATRSITLLNVAGQSVIRPD